ncbi:hypothetical protein ARAM_006750 [Aspergillus rambellii]|uniref:Zn(2)-C6 fungal-type domain-containing protein n=2 Tax=Aspergillus subgen. Nidulantes TaxID=2720870 RepID=A0A0F8U018_9EURO|nr:hypothetical protein ARAM_006750 [Aspergillus rambellii]KKK17227.1 hypothetical protein AOCH_004788 [Aspergillus ochraceoroseus]
MEKSISDHNLANGTPRQLPTPLDSSPGSPFAVATPTNSPPEVAVEIAAPQPRVPRNSRSLQRITHACVSCQKKKTKCDGAKPTCKLCQRAGTICIYARSRRENQRLRFHSLEEKITVYESLLQEIISQSTPENIHSIRDAIHRHFQVSPDFFSTLLASKSLSDQHISQPKPGLSLTRIHLTRGSTNSKAPALAQQPPIQVKSIENWTWLVDNDVASHLLSLYFTWENSTWHLVDQHMFIHDLERGRPRFCSSLLVHTLLFFGCSFSYNLTRITDRREEKALGERLYAAIQQQWTAEKDSQNLPTVQSSILIGLLCCTFGLDKLGTNYILHGAELSNRFDLNKANSAYFLSGVEDDPTAVSNCQKLVAWAVFDIQALACQVYRKKPIWKEPPSIGFTEEEASALDEGGEWRPYPFQTPVSQPYLYTAAWIRSELVAIVHDIACFSLKFPGAVLGDSDWDYGYSLYQRLLGWRARLPWTVLPRHNTTPHALCLHFYYQATLVSLCENFLLNSSMSPDGCRSSRFDPLIVKSHAMDTFGSLVLLFKHYHGWKSIPIIMLHYFCVAGVHSVSKLHPHEPKWSLVLESSVVGLWHMSLGWGRFCKAFLRTIGLVLKATNPDPSLVPPRATAVLDQLSGSLWTGVDTSSLAADYVVHHIPDRFGQNLGPGSAEYKAHTLQSLLVTMEGLSITAGSAR